MQFHNHLRRASSQLLALAVSSTLLGSTYLLPSAAFAQSRVDNTQLLAQNTLIRATSAQTKNLYLNKNRIYSYDLEVSNDTRIMVDMSRLVQRFEVVMSLHQGGCAM